MRRDVSTFERVPRLWRRRRAVALTAVASVVCLGVARPAVASAAAAGITVTTATAQTAVASLLGPDFSASNVAYHGAASALGRFDSDSFTTGFDTGVILSTGDATQAVGPNLADTSPDLSKTASGGGATSTEHNTLGDADVAAAAGTTLDKTADAAVLEFDFVPTTDAVTFNYVFASEEYNEYVSEQYNDAFVFLVDGVNCALVPGTSTPVSIHSVNDSVNSVDFIDNSRFTATNQPKSPLRDIAYDGLTTPLACTAAVHPGVTNHVKLAIADVGDDAIDSAVLLQGSSFVPATPPPPGFTVTSPVSPSTALSTLLGAGLTTSGLTYTGANSALGTYTDADGSTVGFHGGVVLSTGKAQDAEGPNTADQSPNLSFSTGTGATSTDQSTGGDADVAAAAGTTADKTADAAVLQFDFVPSTSVVTFNYVFASEEYNEYVSDPYNDAFVFLINGVNCALIPGTSTPVSIHNVNLFAHGNEFVDNSLWNQADGAKQPTRDIAYDGLTRPLACTAAVRPGVTNHAKLAIADVADAKVDSAVFLQANSFTPYVNEPPVVTVPTNIVAQATGATGATVTYTASASDDHDGTLPTSCTPASDAVFPIGSTDVACSATDSAGMVGTAGFTVVVQDTSAPVLALPDTIVAEATGPSGAAVTYTAAASDVVDGAVTPNCDHGSGDQYPLGSTTVTCTATDAHGNTASDSFKIAVQDTTAPALHVPADITVEATGPAGAAVTYQATAADLVDGDVAPTCTTASGDTFPVGDTGVKCTATDAAGNASDGFFTVHVVDTTAPTLTLPPDLNVQASGVSTPVTWTATATDAVDGTDTVSCDPASGSGFAAGITTVTCSAADASGNSRTGSFKVDVEYTKYQWQGFLQPINDTAHTVGQSYSVFKAGSTVPVKFHLIDSSGQLVQAPSAPVWLAPQRVAATSLSVDESVYSAAATSDSTFRYDPASQEYIFNWATSKSQGGSYWRIGVRFDDGSTQYVVIALR